MEIDRIIADTIKKIRFLLDNGFTFCFIAHEGIRKDDAGNEKIYPRGSKRIVDPIVDLVGYIGYVKSNGTDENGKVIKSSLYLSDDPLRLGGGRFTTVTPILQEFTADALVSAIENAAEEEATKNNTKTVSNETVVQERTKAPAMSYEEVKEKCIALCKQIASADPASAPKAKAIIEKHLGADRTISEHTDSKQTELLTVIYNELCILADDLMISK